MTYYIAAYDTEQWDVTRYGGQVPTCLESARRIVEVHRRHQMPATFFVVGRALESDQAGYRATLDDPLFEVASHTYSHRMLRDHPFCGPAASPSEIREEIWRGKEVIEQTFGRRCVGLRTGCGFSDGLSGAPELTASITEAGYTYVSSRLWGPEFSLPAPLYQPTSYAAEGCAELWELPGHGWHENLLKGHNRIFGMGALRVLLYPPLYPEAIPDGFIRTPDEEFHYNNRFFLDRAIAEDATFVSLIWHPWSLMMFDPEMRMLEMTFDYVRRRGLKPITYASLRELVVGEPPIARSTQQSGVPSATAPTRSED
jgi:peptidoglycan/xylan/chitin deacetylase (PgdA/CDA1 family)